MRTGPIRPGSPRAHGALLRRVAALATAGLVVGLAQVPAAGTSGPAARAGTLADGGRLVTPGDPVAGLSDLDTRGTALPSAAQRRAADALGADVRWNQLGTPASLYSDHGLGVATSADPVTAARSWLSAHHTLLGLSATEVSRLQLVNNQHLAHSPARAVLFRQRFGQSDLVPALDSMVTVGVGAGRIAFVSSSLTKGTSAPPPAALTPIQGWLDAARSVGRHPTRTSITHRTSSDGWRRLDVQGFAQQQQVRLRALAMADGTVRPVFEANVVDAKQGSAFAYTVLVDGITGQPLHRQNLVENSSNAYSFQGETTATSCGPHHPFELTDDKTQQIVVSATAANPANDIVVKLFDPNGQLLTSGDTGTSPEAATYAPGDTLPPGVYTAQVCPFPHSTVPLVPPYNYAGSVVTSDSTGPQAGVPYPPRWKYFEANPSLNWSATRAPHNRVVGCWQKRYQDGERVPGCFGRHAESIGALDNLASRGPWDVDMRTDQPTFTSLGNNASDREAWFSPLTPGGEGQAPVSPQRHYTDDFTDTWNNSRCDPSNLVPGGNDILASVTNLFVAHNKMHDWAYYLGFTEKNYNLQRDNYGKTPADQANDPEIGNVQAGAVTGGQPSYLGRDNANQIALQDGVPGITNQYLFQPIAGSFYSPCTDGALDLSITGHEYTHAISNRMIGGPDEGITSDQGGAMGESWSDLDAMELQFALGYSTGTNPWVVGAYATGNKSVGIRDYAINHNPLNYSDIGFDTTGAEVHADGEVWNGTQWRVRRALVERLDPQAPYGNRKHQLRCARGTADHSPVPAQDCPGNRRWIQLIFDSFLLQQGATSMLDARDAMLAADQMRFHGHDLKAMWSGFAHSGMGRGAVTKTANAVQPTPSFASPKARNGRVRFRAVSAGHPVRGKVFIGRYEARATPVADTLRTSKRDATAAFAPGRYHAIFQARGFGMTRFTFKPRPGQHRVRTVHLARNLASAATGARVARSSAGSLNATALIDDTEATNWGGQSGGDNIDTRGEHPFVVVDLAGKRPHRIHRIQVSAMLHPSSASGGTLPLAQDPDSGSRFTALRRFALETCVHGCGQAGHWHRLYTSHGNAFPAKRPRPVAPNLIMRGFDVKNVRARFVRFVALENQCTGFHGYAGEQDSDPANATSCKGASDRGTIVHAAELQVY